MARTSMDQTGYQSHDPAEQIRHILAITFQIISHYKLLRGKAGSRTAHQHVPQGDQKQERKAGRQTQTQKRAYTHSSHKTCWADDGPTQTCPSLRITSRLAQEASPGEAGSYAARFSRQGTVRRVPHSPRTPTPARQRSTHPKQAQKTTQRGK